MRQPNRQSTAQFKSCLEKHGGWELAHQQIDDLKRLYQEFHPEAPGPFIFAYGGRRGDNQHRYVLMLRPNSAGVRHSFFSPEDKQLFCDYYSAYTQMYLEPETLISVKGDPFSGRIHISVTDKGHDLLGTIMENASIERLSGGLRHER